MSSSDMPNGIGASTERREDPSAITGQNQYTDDLSAAGMVHLAFVRSQHGHAIINSIDTSSAKAHEDVLDVFTASDISSASEYSLGRIPLRAPPFPDSSYPPEEIYQPAIADKRVRHQGEVIAVVVATKRRAAHDAVSSVDVDYEKLECVVSPLDALDEDAPAIHEACPDNIAFDGSKGDKATVEEIFESAAHTVQLEKPLQRLAPLPLEPRAVLVEYDQSTDRLTFRPTTQIPHAYRRLLSQILSHPENKIDVVAPSMGGGFGARQHPYPEDILAGWCSMYLNRPVKWRASRIENQEMENDGRGYEGTWGLAVDDEGQILAIKSDICYDLGAWIARASPALVRHSFDVMTGQYDVPEAYCRIRGVLTNTSRVDAYRGVTETDMILMLERLVDRVADEVGLDPAEMRQSNFVSADDFPYETATGAMLDSGDYATNFDRALEMVGYEEIREKQQKLRERDRYIGIGISSWIEKTGLGPCGIANEPTWGYGRVQVHPKGEITIDVGSSNHGQGHQTSLAQIAAEQLKIPFEDVEIIQNDTSRVPEGVGTYASRTAAVEGGAVSEASERILEKLRRVAGHHLEADENDLKYRAGEFAVKGAPERSIPFYEAAQKTLIGADLPEGTEPGVEATSYYNPEAYTFPFGTHIAVVEVDPECGEVEFEDYVIVEDCGQQINPMIVEGQIHGGTAQGIGQALYENVHYDDNGNLTTASLQDYVLPKSVHIPHMRSDHTVTPSPNNPLGVKGMGESGTIAAPGAVINAIEDALNPFDPEPIDLPATAERIWRSIDTN